MKKGVSSNNLVVTVHFSLKISSHPCFAGPLGIIYSASGDLCSFPELESDHFKFLQETENIQDDENIFRQYELKICNKKLGAFNRSPK
jgi:hypothetical protein